MFAMLLAVIAFLFQPPPDCFEFRQLPNGAEVVARCNGGP